MRLADAVLKQCFYHSSSELNLDSARDFGLTPLLVILV